MTTGTVNVLPFDTRIGYPQKQRFVINNVTYDIYYRWNFVGEFVTARIVQVADGVQLWSGKLPEQWVFEIKNLNSETLMLLWIESANATSTEGWVFWD